MRRIHRNVLLGLLLVVAAMLSACTNLDAMVQSWWAEPISSGQTKAVLRGLRTWGEGSTLIVLAIGFVLAQPRRWREPALMLTATLLVAAIVDGIKPISGRKRPQEASVAGSWHAGAGRNSSFPSGHCASAFAFARVLALSHPAVAPLCYVAAAGTATSRMYDQRHYLSDCLIGGLLGWTTASLLWGLARRKGWVMDAADRMDSEPANPHPAATSRAQNLPFPVTG